MSVNRSEYDYEFHSETGCYLAGSTKVSPLRNARIFKGFDDSVKIEIECNSQE